MLEKACNPPEAVASGKRRKLAKVSAIGRKIGRLPAKGTGYSGNAHEDVRADELKILADVQDSGQREAELNQTKTDDATAKLLSQLAVYLPNMKRSRTFTSDSMVHPTALAHLRRRSGFVNDLLRNNSLLDMTARNDIYCTLLDWLEIVANHEALAAMLAMPQMRPMATEPGPQADSVLVTYECRPSPRELLETLVIQAAATLRGLASSSPVGTPLSPMSAMPSAPPPSAAVSPPPATSPFFQTALEDDIESAQNAALKTFW
jgi:hypothetical protein